ncbi:MAG: hypothetical protein P4L46_11180 [Fimbriimonas sp.]|nr:hypothetical protein [Fimbriimonas sp.]
MSPIHEAAGLAAMVSLWLLGITRVKSMLWGLALQGGALSMILLIHAIANNLAPEIFLGMSALLLKAVVIPLFLNWSAHRLKVDRDWGVGLAPGMAMLIGAVVLMTCYFQSARFSPLSVPSGTAGYSIAMVLIGVMIMITRRLAMGILVGFLVLDNGIFAYSVTETAGLPAVIELGVMFDLFVAVLLTGMVLFRVSRSFEHMDVSKMRELHE